MTERPARSCSAFPVGPWSTRLLPKRTLDGLAVFLAVLLAARGDASAGTAWQLTTDPARDDHPSWSPDGSMIAFHSDRTGNFDIWVIPAGGGVPLQVTTTTSEDMNPVWSPNGTEIAYDSFTGSGWKDIWAIGLGGGTPRRITTQTGEDADPDWSPDGQTIVYTRIPVPNPTTSAELWRIPAGGGVPSPVLADPNAFDQDPVWSPDGAQVLFQSSRNNNSDLWVAPASGGPLTRATTDAAWDWHPAWSKDEAIVFSSNRAGNFDIWVLPSIQDVPVQITTDPGSDGSPAWSPDGTMIAFSSDPSGNFDIWVVPYPTTAVEARSWGALKALYRE